jgi:hypothetical protein
LITQFKTNDRSLRKVIYLSINGFLLMRHGDFQYYRNLQHFFRGEALKEVAVDVLKVAYEGTCQEEKLVESLTKMLHNSAKGLA